jgi:hypothetical protein
VKFYSVGDRLIRRRTRVRLANALELWNGTEWTPYTDMNAVLRHGQPLTEVQALSLLHELRGRATDVSPWSEREERLALRTPSKRH